MTDIVQLLCRAGFGGNGKVSFRREKFVPKGGPDGGHGGDGGTVYIVARKNRASLQHLAGVAHIESQPGQSGGGRNMIGHKGEDTYIEVPVGTVVWLIAENEPAQIRRMKYGLSKPLIWSDVEHPRFYQEKPGQTYSPYHFDSSLYQVTTQAWEAEADELLWREPNDVLRDAETPRIALVTLDTPDEPYPLCQGGFGGRGNESFKSSVQTTPREAEYGTPGEMRLVVLEHKMLADIGLVGFPNAGKSTLLSVLTKARPKIANYPFTTLYPNLGLCAAHGQEWVVADLPGLIEGASEGKGLGFQFLRHAEHCSGLLFVVYLPEDLAFDAATSQEEKVAIVWQQYQQLLAEFTAYNVELTQKPHRVILNKVDVLSPELLESIQAQFSDNGQEIIPISAVTNQGTEEVITAMSELRALQSS